MAAIYPNANIKGLTYIEETTFGTDPGGSPARYWAGAIKAAIEPAMIPDPIQQSSGLAGDRPRIRGAEGGKLTFEAPLYTYGGNESPFIALAKRCGCSHIAVAASVEKITGGTATTIVCLTADKGNLAVGVGLMHLSALGTSSLRFITREQVDTPAPGSTTFTVNEAFATTPVVDDSWGATDTLIPATGVQAKSFTFHVYEGGVTANSIRKTMSGCVGKWKLNSMAAGALMNVAWEWMVDNFAPPAAATLAMAARLGSTPLCALGATVHVADAAIAIKSLDFDPGLALQWDPSHGGAQGRAGAFYGKPNPVIAFSPLMDVDWWTRLTAGTALEFFYTKHVTATDAMGIYVPAFEVEGMGEEDDGALVRAAPKLHVIDGGLNADSTQLPMWSVCVTH